MNFEEEYKRFENIMVGEIKAKDIEPIWVSEDGMMRLYISDLNNGLNAHCIKWVTQYPSDNTQSIWDGEVFVESVFELEACFDGIRHLYFANGNGGDDFDGYINYPNMQNIIAALTICREEEVKKCWAIDK